jgi:hypothetical protein
LISKPDQVRMEEDLPKLGNLSKKDNCTKQF